LHAARPGWYLILTLIVDFTNSIVVTNQSVTFHVLVLAASVTGCAGMLPPARSKGAQFSDDGVHVAVIGQQCVESPDPSRPGKTLLDLTLAIEVGNATLRPIVVHRERITLVLPSDVPVRTSTPVAALIMDVDPGTTTPFELRFVAQDVKCTQELRLETSAALESRDRLVAIGAVRFVPRE
jgi:hypothetical protein